MGHMGFGEEYIMFNFDVFGKYQYLLLINQISLQKIGGGLFFHYLEHCCITRSNSRKLLSIIIISKMDGGVILGINMQNDTLVN
jgi:hypothetical protein